MRSALLGSATKGHRSLALRGRASSFFIISLCLSLCNFFEGNAEEMSITPPLKGRSFYRIRIVKTNVQDRTSSCFFFLFFAEIFRNTPLLVKSRNRYICCRYPHSDLIIPRLIMLNLIQKQFDVPRIAFALDADFDLHLFFFRIS